MTTPYTPHLEAQLQNDLDLIRRGVLEMASLDEKVLGWALQSFVKQDRQLAYSVILRDQDVDQLEADLDKLCLTFLLRHQPVAGHLRFVYSASKIIKELERIGDYAESIGRQVLQLSSMKLDIPTEGFEELASQSIALLHNAVQAFVEGNIILARATKSKSSERHIREMRDAVSAHILSWQETGRIPADAYIPLTTVVRRFERVMEQAINISEETVYALTGEYLKHELPKSYHVLFIGDTNACVSQMAEAIAKSKNYPKLSFASAGVAPGAVDPRIVKMMAEKGMDLSGYSTKPVEQVQSLDRTHVAVALTIGAEMAFSLLPKRALKLTWFVPEFATTDLDEAQYREHFEQAFKELDTQIQDLAKAILRDDKE